MAEAAGSRRGFLAQGGARRGLTALLGAALPSEPSRKHLSVSRRAMACNFSLLFPAGYPRPIEAGCAALDEVERLEEKLSVYRPESDISYLNRAAWESPVTADAEVFDLCQIAARITAETGGAFDIAAGALARAWGFYRGPKRVPSGRELEEALAASGMAQVELEEAARTVRYRRRGVEINLGAIGKGYAIDRALALVRARFGPAPVLMQGGQSSFRAIGAPPGEPRGWKIAIGDPFQPRRALLSVRLRDRALGTSAATHQYFVEAGRRYGHILDPRTGRPAERLASASVLAPTAAEADALSTAFFVMGLEPTRQYCRLHRDIGAVLVTRPAPGRPPEVVVLGSVDAKLRRAPEMKRGEL